MSALVPDSPSISSSGYSDGLGRREIGFDRETGTLLERLYVRPEVGVFGAAITARVDRLQSLADERFARPIAVERESGRVVVVSEYVAGVRVRDLLDTPDALQDAPTLDLALAFLLEALPALQSFHEATGGPHGLISTGRTVLTASPHVVFLDSSFGDVIGRLHYSRSRLWGELGLALPPSAAPSRFTVASDIAQVGLTALMLVLGRTIREDEYLHGLPALVTEVADVALIRGTDAFAGRLQQFLQTALPISGQQAYDSAQHALDEIREIAELEMGTAACGRALSAFIEQIEVGAQPLPAALGETPGTSEAGEPEEDLAVDISSPAYEDDVEAVLSDIRDVVPLEQEIAITADAEADVLDLSLTADGQADSDSEALTASADSIPELAADLADPTHEEPSVSVASDGPDEYRTSFQEEASVPLEPAYDAAAHDSAADAVSAFEEPAPAFEETLAALPQEAEPAAAARFEEPAAAWLADTTEIEQEPVPARTSFFSPRRKKDDKSKSARARKDRLRSAAAALKETVFSRVTHHAEPAPPAERAAASSAERPPVERPAAAAPPEPPPVAAPPLAPPRPKPAIPSLIPAQRAAQFEPPIPDAPAAAPHPFVPPPTAPAPAPVSPAAAAPQPATFSPPAPPMPVFNTQPVFAAPSAPPPPAPIPLQSGPAISLSPSAPSIPFSPSTPALKLKSTPISLAPPPKRERFEPPADRTSYLPPPKNDAPRGFPWKLAAAALVIVLAGVVAGRAYLPDRKAEQERAAAEAAAIAAAAKLPPVKRGPAPVPSGKVVIETQPAGAKVLMDGLAAGQTPLTLDSVPAGRHVVTLISESGSVKRTIKVEAGQTVTLNEQIYGGWVAIFAPITFEVSEKGRAIGNTEEGRLMLSPGRHELTLTNKALGYSAVHTVDIEPGEVRSLTLEPKGTANFNAVPWAEVWVDDQKIGETPIANLQLPLGVHNVVFKHPQLGERKLTATIRASEPVALSVDFDK